MKINQFDVRKGNKVETVLVVPFNTEANIKEIAEKHLVDADEVIVTIWKYGKKVETLSFVKEVEVAPAQVEEVKEEVKTEAKPKPKLKKSDVFFKVGESYPVFYRTRGLKNFTVENIDLENNFVWGKINDGEVKKYKAKLIIDKLTDTPEEYSITVDKRTNTIVGSKYTV